jgi:MAF protein
MTDNIILASASPRRVELLKLLGIGFQTDVSAIEEDLETFSNPEQRARDLALAKARVVATRHPGSIILAADTLIAFRGRLLGKPGAAQDAVDMLRALRQHWHPVITGVAVIDSRSDQEFVADEVTRVLMRRYSDAEIAAYVASGDPIDKAAAYAIQNRDFHPVERLDVCYTNVMGLPLCTTRDLLVQAGVHVPAEGTALRSARCSFCEQMREK